MDFVVDANILFSVLIKKGKTEELIFNDSFCLFAPEFIFEEFLKYKEIISEKTERKTEDFLKLLRILMKRIKTVPNEETERFIAKAKEICPDKKDVDYFALAIKLDCSIWSNDKDLKKQNVIKIYSTEDLLKLFDFTS